MLITNDIVLSVAVLPYIKREHTYPGSSTRSYEHFAACRPILSTKVFAELLERRPLLTMCNSIDKNVSALMTLKQSRFRDGDEVERWQLAKESTWHHRAERMLDVLDQGQGQQPLPRGALQQ